jgi:hypothetical protein
MNKGEQQDEERKKEKRTQMRLKDEILTRH